MENSAGSFTYERFQSEAKTLHSILVDERYSLYECQLALKSFLHIYFNLQEKLQSSHVLAFLFNVYEKTYLKKLAKEEFHEKS